MQDQPSRRALSAGLIAGFSVLVLATGSAVAWWTWKSQTQTVTGPNKIENTQQPDASQRSPLAPDSSASKTNPPNATTASEKTLQVYWLTPTATSFELSPQPVEAPSNGNPNTQLEAAMTQLLKGPSTTSVSSTIPEGTKLLALSQQQDGIHLNLSKEFTQGGGSTAMTGRLAQVLFTATSLNPNAPVWLSVEGKPLETLGGEGLVIAQPITRQQFQQDFPL